MSQLKGLEFNAYITVINSNDNDEALKVAIKDNIYTKGVRTTAASKILYNFIPSYDATIVAKLKKIKAKIIAKTNMHEFAIGGTNTSSAFGITKNPNDPELITGGSSGGSAVSVAVDDADVAIGTDTRGSVRIPAAFCGVYGFKPTFGRISTHGIIPNSWSLDHVGILSKNITKLIYIYRILKGHDNKDPNTLINLSIREKKKKVKRIGIINELTVDCETRNDFMRFIYKLNDYDIEEVELPIVLSISKYLDVFRVETASYHRRFLRLHEQDYSPDVLSLIKQGFKVRVLDYVNTIKIREKMIKEIIKTFNRYDLLVCPTVPIYPPKIKDVINNEINYSKILIRNVAPFNFLKVPAISVPINKFVGAQFIANIGFDEYLLDFVSSLGV
ncbi:MAG: amidase [Saccharolobus sp.]|uniref:amidase n=3 Tax=Sulfolobaceae TaxID=118883 RepID=UPI001F0F4E77|nr:amidase [Saccharolobus shibatae]MCH4815807.1 amidase [Saccharolobus shibatae]